MITIGFKQSGNCWLRAILALGLGIVMLINCIQGTDPVVLLVKVCGCFVIAAGIFSLIYGLIKKNERDFSLMMVNALVDVILGAVLFLFAGAISKIFFYLVGFLLIFVGIWEIITLFSARKWVNTGFVSYLLPIVIIVLGTLLMAPNIGKAIGYIFSAALILYGISDILTLFKIRQAMKALEIHAEDVSRDEEQTESKEDSAEV